MATTFAQFKQNGQWTQNDIKCVVIDFVETSGSGTYTAQVSLGAGTQLLDVRWTNDVLWASSTSAAVSVGDTASATKFINAVNIKTTPAVGYAINLASTGASEVEPFYANGTTITATVTTVGTGAAGVSHLTLLYAGGKSTYQGVDPRYVVNS